MDFRSCYKLNWVGWLSANVQINKSIFIGQLAHIRK